VTFFSLLRFLEVEVCFISNKMAVFYFFTPMKLNGWRIQSSASIFGILQMNSQKPLFLLSSRKKIRLFGVCPFDPWSGLVTCGGDDRSLYFFTKFLPWATLQNWVSYFFQKFLGFELPCFGICVPAELEVAISVCRLDCVPYISYLQYL
jgi:hypothetical protein